MTLVDINDYLPESALRTSENLQEVTEQLGRLGIQVFETPPDEDDILINGMGGGKLAPKDTATRAQFATVLMRFLDKN